MNELIIIEKTNNIKEIEELALSVGQESTVDTTDRLKIGLIAKINKKSVGGIALFGFCDGFVIDYISPSITSSNFIIIEKLIKNLIHEATIMTYNPLMLVRDKNDLPFLVERFDFKKVDFDELPLVYKKRTLELCARCVKYQKKCYPVTLKYSLKYNKNKSNKFVKLER